MPYFFRFESAPMHHDAGALRGIFWACRFLIFLGALLIVTPAAPVYADDAQRLTQAIEQQKSALKKTRKAQDLLTNQLRTTQTELDQSEKKQNEIEDRIAAIEAQQFSLEKQSTQLADEITHLKMQIDHSLRIAYLLGNQAPLSTLLSRGDTLSSERYLYYIRLLVSQSINQLNALKDAERALQANQLALQKVQLDLNEAKTQLASAIATHQKQLTQQNQLLHELSLRADKQTSQLAQLLARKKALDDQIAKLNAQAKKKRAEEAQARKDQAQKDQAGSSRQNEARQSRAESNTQNNEETSTRGDLSARGIPVSGRVFRPYGAPIAEGDMRAQGILYFAPPGTPVRAVSAGEVVFADHMKGWGDLVILRHAHGYLSLYAHNSKLMVHTGMRVKQGTVLGLSGQINGRETGTYFEVRKGNDPINPRRWAPYRSLKN